MSFGDQFDKATPADTVSSAKLNDIEQDEQKRKFNDECNAVTASPRCPFGYDAHTFKLGPLSCIICNALLFESSKCMPCSHKFCKTCISRFSNCPLCGVDITKIEPDTDMQEIVDRFIEGHARIKRVPVNPRDERDLVLPKNVIYEDVSMERGAFLVQQATRAFRARNISSAKSRLNLCSEDLKEQLEKCGDSLELCLQLGAVLGMLGDCCRAIGDVNTAVNYFEESITFLSKLPTKDLEVVHTLSVSLNKIGDLNYYDGNLPAARSYYSRALDVRRSAVTDGSNLASQILDVAVSLVKVADVDKALGCDYTALKGFQDAIKALGSLTLTSDDEAGLEQRRQSLLEFIQSQVAEYENSATPACNG